MLPPERRNLSWFFQGKYRSAALDICDNCSMNSLFSKIFIDREGRAAPQDGAPWAKDGSFMVFRKLRQNVLEFEKYERFPSLDSSILVHS